MHLTTALGVLSLLMLAGCTGTTPDAPRPPMFAESPMQEESHDSHTAPAEPHEPASGPASAPASEPQGNVSSDQTPHEPESTPGTVDAKPKPPRNPVIISGRLPMVDAGYYDQYMCGAYGAVTSTATRGISWNEYPLPQDLSGWSVRLNVAEYAFGFPKAPLPWEAKPMVVPDGATKVRICNIGAIAPFELHFLAPEHLERLDQEPLTFKGHLAAPPADVHFRGDCLDVVFPWSSVTGASTLAFFELPPSAAGQPFLVDVHGVVVQFSGAGAPPDSRPSGIVPAGATGAVVCATSGLDVDFQLRIATGDP